MLINPPDCRSNTHLKKSKTSFTAWVSRADDEPHNSDSALPLGNDERFQNTVARTKFMTAMLASGGLAEDKLLSLRCS